MGTYSDTSPKFVTEDRVHTNTVAEFWGQFGKQSSNAHSTFNPEMCRLIHMDKTMYVLLSLQWFSMTFRFCLFFQLQLKKCKKNYFHLLNL